MNNQTIIVVGAGLAGSEAAWQLAEKGFHVQLYEMRPNKQTGAHISDKFGELVCSNSLGSNMPDRAAGVLKSELRKLNSLLMKIADETALPAGGALAVDRDLFAARITEQLSNHSNIEIFREEVTKITENPTIIASGPLTSNTLNKAISEISNQDHLYFYDAIAPIVYADSIDMSIAFSASRYERGLKEEGDYINCPFTKEQYLAFIHELINAERIQLRPFEREIEDGVDAGPKKFFEGCLPVEVLANRNIQALAYGPLRPVGLFDPRSDQKPYAVLQLRQDNLAGDLYNIVGFQTNLTFKEQKRVFRLIPGLNNARFARYGQMHRNTFINSPVLLEPTLKFKNKPQLFFAGQITGVEGYVGNIATGLIAAINLARLINDEPLLELPQTTMLGALLHYITHANSRDFQPMKANFGILPPLEKKIRSKNDRYAMYSKRANIDFENFTQIHRI
ncbi:MAG: methylenetetrahydrofolate--tRNA-(uracil(54)-C(5))-methyltransferase (FADH(2)-oxidizing) TrmFO [Anaerolineaceae bacterium]|nr:methylenetetrahydrofolate--tRNA-(uracil(54)-C(5))-methyltransferase (FADH(2)-oxidizing) TrmFO [Anaerolineaceae bacterium]